MPGVVSKKEQKRGEKKRNGEKEKNRCDLHE